MASRSSPLTFVDIDTCVDAILARVGNRIVLGLPVGIGKPNELVNAITRRALADSKIQLTIFTALSLRLPKWHNDLERRFLQPFIDRVFGDYEELVYTQLLERNALPSNIVVCEFFLEPGAWLNNAQLQQHYLSANYTHVARDLIKRGVNVIAQLVAPDPQGGDRLSMSCNPDLVVDLLPYVNDQREQGNPVALIAQLHRELPFMYGDALVSRDVYDYIVDTPKTSPLFCPPNMPLSTTDYAIAMHVTALIKDGGTIQIGIGELGDAIVYALKLRHEQPQLFKEILISLGIDTNSPMVAEGGTESFQQGLYGCSEMLVDGFVDLYKAGILKRKVYPHALLQRLLDSNRISTTVTEDTLAALAHAGLHLLTPADFTQLKAAGVFRDDATYVADFIVAASGEKLSTNIDDVGNRTALARSALGNTLRGGVLVHGGFFMGPKGFYAALAKLPDAERQQFAMQRISFINELYGDVQLKIAQRRHARFVNTTMMITGLGAAVSDGLENGRVVSGVGGQYNFVAMAHALSDARSILCVRSTRTSKGTVTSNIIWNYGHETIPRHLRDVVVTEYGVADLRGRTDGEVVDALVRVMDARFQEELVAQAKQAGKLPKSYNIPDAARKNLPAQIESVFIVYKDRNLFDPLPFGSDFTDEERVITKALKRLQSDTATSFSKIKTVLSALLAPPPTVNMEPLLQRMQLSQPTNNSERLQRRLVAHALRRCGVQ
jgi:acyl-CoA hydrolase